MLQHREDRYDRLGGIFRITCPGTTVGVNKRNTREFGAPIPFFSRAHLQADPTYAVGRTFVCDMELRAVVPGTDLRGLEFRVGMTSWAGHGAGLRPTRSPPPRLPVKPLARVRSS